MSIKKEIIDELDTVLVSIRKAEQNIIGKDSSDKLEIVNKLINLENEVKSIKNSITVPTLDITENTLIEEAQKEKLLSTRTGNVLRREGYKTIGDITNHTVREIRTVRNIGKRCADEVIEFLNRNGLSPKQYDDKK